MLRCSFCSNDRAPTYLYTICSHFVCINCAALRLDPFLKVLSCCGKPTYLEEKASQQLIKKNKQILKNIERKDKNERSQISQVNEESLNVKKVFKIEKDNQLEGVLKIQIDKVRKEFEEQHKILKERQNQIINRILSVYDQQMGNTETKVKTPAQKSEKILQISLKDEKLNQSRKESCYDGILKKLQINQQRMDAKLQKYTD